MAVADTMSSAAYPALSTAGGGAGVYGSAALSVAGLVGTVFAVREQSRQMKAFGEAAEREVLSALNQANDIERIAYQRAYASLFDIATVNAVHDETIRGYVHEGRMKEGEIIAQTAAAGLAFTGSPVLAAAAVAGEVARATAFEQFKRRIQVRKFTFEVGEELFRGQQARLAADITVQGIQASTTAQAISMQTAVLKESLNSLRTTLGYAQSPTIQDALSQGYRYVFPRQQTALTPPPGAAAPGTTAVGP